MPAFQGEVKVSIIIIAKFDVLEATSVKGSVL
jgi:hypothetical protein